MPLPGASIQNNISNREAQDFREKAKGLGGVAHRNAAVAVKGVVRADADKCRAVMPVNKKGKLVIVAACTKAAKSSFGEGTGSCDQGTTTG